MKKTGRWRAASLILVYGLFGIHILHWKMAGTTLAPLELNEVLYTLHRGIVTAGFVLMALTLVGTLIWGRFLCSWGCHMLALQDLSAWLLKKGKLKPLEIRSRTLPLVPIAVAVYLIVWPQIQRILWGGEFAGFRVMGSRDSWGSFMTHDFWRNLPGVGIASATFIVCGFLMVLFLGSRGFCRYACPYGVFFSLASKLAPGNIQLTGNCVQCRACTETCESGVRVHEEIAKFGQVVDSKCLKDLDCSDPVRIHATFAF